MALLFNLQIQLERFQQLTAPLSESASEVGGTITAVS